MGKSFLKSLRSILLIQKTFDDFLGIFATWTVLWKICTKITKIMKIPIFHEKSTFQKWLQINRKCDKFGLNDASRRLNPFSKQYIISKSIQDQILEKSKFSIFLIFWFVGQNFFGTKNTVLVTKRHKNHKILFFWPLKSFQTKW